MPICNKILALATAAALFAAPSFADGVPGQKVNRGPVPLQANAMTPPEPGCVLVSGNTWSCPVPQARFTSTQRAAPAPSHRTYAAPAPVTRSYAAPATTTRTYSAPATTTTTRTVTRSAPAPVQTTTIYQARTVAAPTPSGMTLDLASFTGGVGGGVDGGYYGGGSAIILGGDKRFSGVLDSRASAFTFRQRRKGGGGGHNPPPNPGPCGCH